MAEIKPEVDLASPEFSALRGVLARAFLKHRASMGLGDASDEWKRLPPSAKNRKG